MGSNQGHYSSANFPTDIDDLNMWMSQIDDDVSLSSISIPGTHNSCGRTGGDMHKCQSWRLRSQLLAGVRFLDVKCRHMYNALVLDRHRQQINFDDILRTCITFLDENPTETIVMRLQEYKNSEMASRTFRESFMSYLKVYGKRRFFINRVTMPTLGESRGRVLIFGQGSGFEMSPELDIRVLNDNVADGNYSKKWKQISGHMGEADDNKGGETLYVTFCTGFSTSSYPYRLAHRWNLYLLRYVTEQEEPKCHGVVAIDFPGEDLIKAIIASNIPPSSEL